MVVSSSPIRSGGGKSGVKGTIMTYDRGLEAPTAMRRAIAVLFLAAIGCSASPIAGGPCGGGTLDQYIVLGAAGCVFQGNLYSRIMFNGTNGGVAIDTTQLTVSFVDSGSGRSDWNIDAPWFLATNAVLDITYSFSVTGFFDEISTFEPISYLIASLTTTDSACLNGFFTGSACSGTLLPDVGQPGVRYTVYPPLTETTVSIYVDDHRQGNPSGPTFFTDLVNTNVTVPEPGTMAAAGIGVLLLFAGLWRQSISK
jgi:hypothetical protein